MSVVQLEIIGMWLNVTIGIDAAKCPRSRFSHSICTLSTSP